MSNLTPIFTLAWIAILSSAALSQDSVPPVRMDVPVQSESVPPPASPAPRGEVIPYHPGSQFSDTDAQTLRPDQVCQTCGKGHCICHPTIWGKLFPHLAAKYHSHWKPCLQESHWGYPENFCERPYGSYLRYNLNAQIANGLVQQQVLYEYDFADGSANLTGRGHYQLLKMMQRMQTHPFLLEQPAQVIVQQSRNKTLDQARQQAVVRAARELGFPLEADQVLVSRQHPRALDSYDAQDVYDSLRRITTSAGAAAAPGNAGGSGGTGAGLGGGFGR